MGIRAVQIIGKAGSPTRSEIDIDSIQVFSRLRSSSTPAAYIIEETNLKKLEDFKDIVVNRGKKHPAKPLSALLLGHSRIPSINGGFQVAGKLLTSIQTLLKNAIKRNDQNIYVIGARPEVFEQVWERAESGAEMKAAPQNEEFSSVPGEPDMSRLFREEIPVSLSRRFVGDSYEVRLVRQLIMLATKSRETVLILGDSGTGKEIVARCIHDYHDPIHSLSFPHPFVPVNCGAIPGELLEAVLFGHEKGIYTDATIRRDGLWKEAGNGTLFLDEIGDLRLDHQAKVLRALQERKVRPLGSSREVDVPARVVVATNRDLFSMMRAGLFREDLYYRLRTYLIRTPALREHPEDIPVLARFFWKDITGSEQSTLPERIVLELQTYRWPGNARELRAVLTNLYILFGNENLDVEHLQMVFQLQGQTTSEIPPNDSEKGLMYHRVECLRHLRRVDEVVHACKVVLTPVVEMKKEKSRIIRAAQVSLKRHLNELEWLCLHPLLFHSEFTFQLVYRLKGKLSYFMSVLERGHSQAVRFWKRELSQDFQLAVTTLFKEVHQLLQTS